MSRKVLEIFGYIINALSVAVFFILANILKNGFLFLPLPAIGWPVLAGGGLLVVLSITALNTNRGKGLITRGIYGLVRHPMYLGAMLIYLSYSIFLPHWVIFLISMVIIAIIYAFIREGDSLNINRFGDEYEGYMKKVPGINLVAGVVKRLARR